MDRRFAGRTLTTAQYTGLGARAPTIGSQGSRSVAPRSVSGSNGNEVSRLGSTWNPGAARDRVDLQLERRAYEIGTEYGHMTLGVSDARDAYQRIRAAGG